VPSSQGQHGIYRSRDLARKKEGARESDCRHFPINEVTISVLGCLEGSLYQEALRYVLSLPIASLVSGIDSEDGGVHSVAATTTG
jgi:hypothetical protein